MKTRSKKAKRTLVLNHVDGSRKSKVHARFDAKGPEVAFAYGVRVGLKESTLKSWFVQFRKCKPTQPSKVRVAKVKAGVPDASVRADSVLIPAQA